VEADASFQRISDAMDIRFYSASNEVLVQYKEVMSEYLDANI